jgi:hypothetical protein
VKILSIDLPIQKQSTRCDVSALSSAFKMIGVMKTMGSFAELKRTEVAVKVFIRFVLAKAALIFGIELMSTSVFFHLRCANISVTYEAAINIISQKTVAIGCGMRYNRGVGKQIYATRIGHCTAAKPAFPC